MSTELQGDTERYRLQLNGVRSGGQAIVYQSQTPDGPVAIKVARDVRVNKWIARERDALLSLRAKGEGWIVRLLDHGTTPDGRIFLVLPWYPLSLQGWLDTDPPLERRLEALALACETVIRLHRSTLDFTDIRIHRDIKPDNFLVRDEGGRLSVVLADLGGVKEGSFLSVGQQTAMHTPHFAPPEQMLPLECAPDPSVDVHALAVTVYWSLVGEVPRAVFTRQVLFGSSVQRLLTLHRRQKRLEGEECDEYNTLRTQSISTLFDLEEAEPLLPEDERRLRAHLLDSLTDRVPEPEPLAEALCAVLVEPLRRALAPDAERRDSDARRLLAACRKARKLLVDDGLSEPIPAPPTPTTTPVAGPKTWVDPNVADRVLVNQLIRPHAASRNALM
jgi:serine/threonine protein kinase